MCGKFFEKCWIWKIRFGRRNNVNGSRNSTRHLLEHDLFNRRIRRTNGLDFVFITLYIVYQIFFLNYWIEFLSRTRRPCFFGPSWLLFLPDYWLRDNSPSNPCETQTVTRHCRGVLVPRRFFSPFPAMRVRRSFIWNVYILYSDAQFARPTRAKTVSLNSIIPYPCLFFRHIHLAIQISLTWNIIISHPFRSHLLRLPPYLSFPLYPTRKVIFWSNVAGNSPDGFASHIL